MSEPTGPVTGPRVRVCVDPLDTATVRRLLSLCDPDAGRLALHPSGHHLAGGAAALIGELLDALGATGNRRRAGRAHEAVLQHALPRLLGHDIRLLVVHGWARVTPAALEALLDLADAAGLRVWLTGPAAPSRRRLLTDRGAVPADAAQLRDALLDADAGTDPPPPPPTRPDAWPPMPADDFPTFRAAMRALLTAAQFTTADALYRATVAESRTRLRPLLTGAGSTAGVHPDSGRILLDRGRLEAGAAAYLHSLVARSPAVPQLTVRLRAAQVAAFQLGWLLQVHLDRLIATAAGPSAAAVASPATWRTLRMYREPHVGALLVLVALGCDLATLLTLPATAVADDGATITVHGSPLPAPPGAAVLLRVQHIAGQLAGRSRDQPFLHAHGDPLTERWVIATVRAAQRDTGIALLSHRLDRDWSGFEWFHRWGISLQELA